MFRLSARASLYHTQQVLSGSIGGLLSFEPHMEDLKAQRRWRKTMRARDPRQSEHNKLAHAQEILGGWVMDLQLPVAGSVFFCLFHEFTMHLVVPCTAQQWPTICRSMHHLPTPRCIPQTHFFPQCLQLDLTVINRKPRFQSISQKLPSP